MPFSNLQGMTFCTQQLRLTQNRICQRKHTVTGFSLFAVGLIYLENHTSLWEKAHLTYTSFRYSLTMLLSNGFCPEKYTARVIRHACKIGCRLSREVSAILTTVNRSQEISVTLQDILPAVLQFLRTYARGEAMWLLVVQYNRCSKKCRH